MADIGFHRADEKRVFGRPRRAEHVGDRAKLHRIANQCAGAMRFNISDAGRGHSGRLVGCAKQVFLAKLAGRSHRAAATAIVVDRAAPYDRMNSIAVGKRLVERLEQDHASAFTAHISVAGGITELAVAVGRHHAALRIGYGDVRLQDQVDPAGERKRGIPCLDASRREVHCRER